MRFLYSLVISCFLVGASTLKIVPNDLLGLPPAQPSVFLPNIVSETNRYGYGSVFNYDNTELYFGVQNNGWSDIQMTRRTRDGWSKPQVIIGSPDFSANDPFLFNDGNRLYFNSPRDEQHDNGYVTRTADGHSSNPTFPSMPINSRDNEYYISFTLDGSMIFASDRNASERGDFDIYLSRRDDNGFQAAVAFPNTINTNGYEADAFIAPDES